MADKSSETRGRPAKLASTGPHSKSVMTEDGDVVGQALKLSNGRWAPFDTSDRRLVDDGTSFDTARAVLAFFKSKWKREGGMAEYPEDVMAASRKLCDDLIQAWLLHHSREEAAEIAAKALMTERQACAHRVANVPMSITLSDEDAAQTGFLARLAGRSDFVEAVLNLATKENNDG